MPMDLGERASEKTPKYLTRSANRNLLKLGLERVQYVGRAIVLLRSFELDVRRDWKRAGELDVLGCVQARASLWKVMDGILDRRRILCGDALPRGNGGKAGPARMIELEPQSIPADDIPSVPEQPAPDPGQSVD